MLHHWISPFSCQNLHQQTLNATISLFQAPTDSMVCLMGIELKDETLSPMSAAVGFDILDMALPSGTAGCLYWKDRNGLKRRTAYAYLPVPSSMCSKEVCWFWWTHSPLHLKKIWSAGLARQRSLMGLLLTIYASSGSCRKWGSVPDIADWPSRDPAKKKNNNKKSDISSKGERFLLLYLGICYFHYSHCKYIYGETKNTT